MIWAIDISSWQDNFNVAQAVAEGYSLIICKATEGTTFRDPWFDANINKIKAANAIPGAYHFLIAGDGAAQARAFHARVVAHGGPVGWFCVCDNEKNATWQTTIQFFSEWNRLTSYHPLVMYTGRWWWAPRGWNGAALTPYLWHSQYVSGSDVGSRLYQKVPEAWWTPRYGEWETVTLLQFSSKCLIAGQAIDVSAFRGTYNDLAKITLSTAYTHDNEDDMGSIFMQYQAPETDAPESTIYVRDKSFPRSWPLGSMSEFYDLVSMARDKQILIDLTLDGEGVRTVDGIDIRVVSRRSLLGDIIQRPAIFDSTECG